MVLKRDYALDHQGNAYQIAAQAALAWVFNWTLAEFSNLTQVTAPSLIGQIEGNLTGNPQLWRCADNTTALALDTTKKINNTFFYNLIYFYNQSFSNDSHSFCPQHVPPATNTDYSYLTAIFGVSLIAVIGIIGICQFYNFGKKAQKQAATPKKTPTSGTPHYRPLPNENSENSYIMINGDPVDKKDLHNTL